MVKYLSCAILFLLVMAGVAYGTSIEGKDFTITYPQENKIGSFSWDKEGVPLDRIEAIMSEYDARWSSLEYSRVYEGGDQGEVYIDMGILKESDNRVRMALEIERFMEMWVQQEAQSTRRVSTGSNFGGHDGKFYESRGTQNSAFAGYWFLDEHRVKIICMKIRTAYYSAAKVAAFKYLDDIKLEEAAKETPKPASTQAGGGGDKKSLQRLALFIGGPVVVVFLLMFMMMDYYRKKTRQAEQKLVEQAEAAQAQQSKKKKGAVKERETVAAKIAHALASEDKSANVKISVSSDMKTLLADGKSKGMIKVRITTMSGDPIDGKKVLFSLAEDNGRLTSESAQAKKGETFNFYTAGTKVGAQMITATLEDNPRVGETIVIQLVKIETIAVDAEKPKISTKDKKGLKIRASLMYSDGGFAVDEVIRLRVLEGDGKVTPAVKIGAQGSGEAIFWPGTTPGKVVIRGESASAPEIFKIVEIEQSA